MTRMDAVQTEKKPKVAAVQITHQATVQEAIDHAYDLVAKHQDGLLKGVDLIAFPDHWLNPDDKAEIASMLEPIPGKITERVGRIARDFNTHLAFPTYERGEDYPSVAFGQEFPFRLYKTNVLLGRDGEVIGKHRRNHYTSAEFLGDDCNVFYTDIGVIGLASCGESFVSELMRLYMMQRVDFLVWMGAYFESTGMEHMPVDEEHLRPIGLTAYDWNELRIAFWQFVQKLAGPEKALSLVGESGATTIYVNSAGKELFAGLYELTYLGQSCIASYDGFLAMAGKDEEIVAAEVDVDFYRKMTALLRRGRRPELYGPLTEPMDDLDQATLADVLCANFQSKSGERQAREASGLISSTEEREAGNG